MPQTPFPMPSLYRAADEAAINAQRRFMRATSARLWFAAAAALLAAGSGTRLDAHTEYLSYAAAVAFVAALGAEVWLLVVRPEQTWYDGRALAESTKTLAWRFAVGGAPFPVHEKDSTERFEEQLAALLDDAPVTAIPLPSPASTADHDLIHLRRSGFAERKAAFLQHRIEDQQRWYATKARHNEQQAGKWKMLLVVIEVLGVALAVAKAARVIHVDLTSVASTAIGCGAAWLAVKQHESVARAYTYASHELTMVRGRIQRVRDEASWAAEVADAEEAISREHTMWRAARSVVDPAGGRGSARS